MAGVETRVPGWGGTSRVEYLGENLSILINGKHDMFLDRSILVRLGDRECWKLHEGSGAAFR